MTDSQNPVFGVPSDDPNFEEAATRARQTFRYFWRELSWEHRRIVPGLDLAVVKASFRDPPEMTAQRGEDGFEVEHMWLSDVTFDGRRLQGTLMNEPSSLQSVHEGDHVDIPGKQICDWMYIIFGEVYGGFTIDALRRGMSPSERKAHDAAWGGLDFGEAGIVNIVPPNYIGQEPPPRKKKGLGALFGKAASPPAPQDYAAVAAAEHPMSVNMRESLEESLRQQPDAVHQADERGFTIFHDLALAGSFDGVDVCLKYGADPNRPAVNGLTPFGLAKSLGWDRVMARLQQAGSE